MDKEISLRGYIFVWDEDKEAINIKKHGIDFTTAAKTFFDPSLVIIWDKKHSDMDEMRYAAFGLSENLSLLVTIHVDKQEKIRIISSRKAEKKEAPRPGTHSPSRRQKAGADNPYRHLRRKTTCRLDRARCAG